MGENNGKKVTAIVGPNGSGKTTFYDLYIQESGVPFINADNIKQITDCSDLDAQDVARTKRLEMAIAGQDFCYETVFSHESKIDEILDYKTKGYSVMLIIIGLENPDLNVARVAQRVEAGKHSVPEDKIRGRIPRVYANLTKVISFCDEVLIYDNSGVVSATSNEGEGTEIEPDFKLQATIFGGSLSVITDNLENWARELISEYI